MAALALQQIGITGTKITPVAAGGSGDTVTPDDRTCVEVTNGSGGAITATVVVPGSLYGQARADIAKSIPNGETHRFGGLVADLADPTTGLISITYSSATSVTVAWVRI